MEKIFAFCLETWGQAESLDLFRRDFLPKIKIAGRRIGVRSFGCASSASKGKNPRKGLGPNRRTLLLPRKRLRRENPAFARTAFKNSAEKAWPRSANRRNFFVVQAEKREKIAKNREKSARSGRSCRRCADDWLDNWSLRSRAQIFRHKASFFHNAFHCRVKMLVTRKFSFVKIFVRR